MAQFGPGSTSGHDPQVYPATWVWGRGEEGGPEPCTTHSIRGSGGFGGGEKNVLTPSR